LKTVGLTSLGASTVAAIKFYQWMKQPKASTNGSDLSDFIPFVLPS